MIAFFTTISPLAIFAGRAMVASLFLISGVTKLSNYAGTQGYMEALGVPGVLLPAVIAFEIAVPLALVIGWQARMSAFLLAGFSLVTAIIFHFNFADQIQSIMFMKNVAIAGGLFCIMANGAGPLGITKSN